MKVYFLAPYPLGESPSQRFRFEHYFPFFSEKGFSYRFQSFWTKKGWDSIYTKNKYLKKFAYLIFGLWRRTIVLPRLFKYDFVFIHREVVPIGPPVFEFFIARILRKKIIYDFDDAIWIENTSEVNKLIQKFKFHHKVAYICEISWRVSVGNSFLKKYALKFNENVVINPTVVNTEDHHSKLKNHRHNQKPVIGWTGTHSTSIYLKMIDQVLIDLKEEMDFDFIVISNQPVDLKFRHAKFTKWNKEQEIEQLLNFDIGIMPLENSIWERGKCGFKIIQYLALGIPAVASPVGVNKKIVEEGENGFFATTSNEWKTALKNLLLNPELRKRLGKNGRNKVMVHFSVRSNLNRFFSTFE